MKCFEYVTNIDVSEILASLYENSELWDMHQQRRIYENSPHKEMVDIWARYELPKNGQYTEQKSSHVSQWYPYADKIRQLKEVCEKIYSIVDGTELGGVLITKLPSGGRIIPHIDSGWHAGYYEKFHVAISTPKGSVFGFECGDLETKNGDVNWFRNDITHWVANDAPKERISMIVCIKTDKYRAVK